MNVMRAIRFLVGVGVVTVPALVLAAQQPAAPHNMPGMAQPAGAAGVAECAQAQPRLLQTIDAANMRLDMARQGNSPAGMRAAMDDLQGALGSLRAQLAACAALQAMAPADAHAGMVMPGTPSAQQSPAAQPGTPVMRPGSTQPAPGAANQNAPAPAAGTPADPHAGHVMPAAGSVALTRDPRCTATVNPETAPRADHEGQAYYFCSERDRQLFVADPVKYLQGAAVAQATSAPRATSRPSAPTRAPASPAAADPHAGHVMPGAAQPAAPARGTGSPAPARPGASRAPAGDPHAGMVMPGAARPQSAAPSTPPQPAAAGHAGMVMPSASAGTSGRSPQPQTGATRNQTAQSAVAPPAAGAGPAAMAMSSGRSPATALAELKCESRVDSRTAPRMLYQGRMYYFCSVEERAEFAKSPEKYVNAPASDTAPAPAH
jgi:YHS domain-containing protein